MNTSPNATRFFLLRLTPPRPNFPADATPDELAAMQRHVGHWMSLMEKGVAHVFGPVADPQGSWGLGVVEVADEAQAQELCRTDPVITAGLGFRLEAVPMPQAIVRR